MGYQSGLSESDGSLVFRRAAILVVCSVKMLRAALALAKIKAKSKPPKKHNRASHHRFLAESLQNIQLTDRLCRIHANQYTPRVFNLATRKPDFLADKSADQPNFSGKWEPDMTLNLRNYAFLFCFILVLALVSGAGPANAESRAYQLNNRPGDDVANQVRELYKGESLSVTARGQQLVVRGDQQLLDEIGTLVETLDVAPAQLRITVRSQEDIGGKRSGGGVTTTRNELGLSVEHRVTSTGSSRERSLMVMDGQSAHITSGQVRTLPFAVRGGRNPAAIFSQVQTRSGFIVSPQVISDRAVELNIVSFEADPAELEGYDTQALVTTRRVEPGQWVSLGSTSTQSTSSQSGIVYNVKSSRSDNRSFEVKVDVIH